jgi:hypothetical protein
MITIPNCKKKKNIVLHDHVMNVFSIYLTEILQLSLMYDMKLPKDLVPYFQWPLWHVISF